MPLKAVVETLDGVDDGIKGLYKQVDQRWVLDVEGVDDHPSIRNLKNAFEATKVRNNELTHRVAEHETKLKELPEDFDPEAWIQYKATAADAEKNRAKKDEEVQNLTQLHQSRLDALTAKKDSEIAAERSKNEFLENQIDGIVRDREITDLLVGVHVHEGLMPAARLLIGNQVKTERLDGGKRRNVVDTNVGPVPLKDWVGTWADSDEGKPFIARASGPDAHGSQRRINGNKVLRADFDKMTPQQKHETMVKQAKGELTVVDN